MRRSHVVALLVAIALAAGVGVVVGKRLDSSGGADRNRRPDPTECVQGQPTQVIDVDLRPEVPRIELEDGASVRPDEVVACERQDCTVQGDPMEVLGSPGPEVGADVTAVARWTPEGEDRRRVLVRSESRDATVYAVFRPRDLDCRPGDEQARVHVEEIEPIYPCLEVDPEIRDTAILELADRARRNELYGWPIRQTEVDRAGVERPVLHFAIYPGEPPYQWKLGFAVTVWPEGWAIGRRILIGLGLTEDEALAMAATCLERLEALPEHAG